MERNRREFLTESVKLLCLTGAATIGWDFVLAGRPQDAPNYDMTQHWWAMAIDIGQCIGCGACVRACKVENDVPDEPHYFRTWVERYFVPGHDPRHPQREPQPLVDSPNGGYDGFDDRYADREDGKSFFVPKLCNHCVDSPCVQVCPVGATFDSPDGVVLVDAERCLGCRYCVQACPYGCRYIDPRTHVVDKCDLCYHRITRGLQPACCEVCPTAARVLGDLRDPDDPIHAFLRGSRIQVLKPNMATGSKVFYRGLDGAVR